MKNIFLIILIACSLPSVSMASVVVENFNDTSVNNNISIISNTGNNSSSSENDGKSQVQIDLEVELNGKSVVDESINKQGRDIELNIDLETKSQESGGIVTTIDKEIVIDGETIENSQTKTEEINTQEQEQRAFEAKEEIINEKIITENPVIKYYQEQGTEPVMPEEEPAEQKPAIETIDITEEEKVSEELNSVCQKEESCSVDNPRENNLNTLELIVNYFVNIFAKLAKLFT